jgi:hypothetical protein
MGYGSITGDFPKKCTILAKLLWSSDSIGIAIAFFVDAAGMLKPNCTSE